MSTEDRSLSIEPPEWAGDVNFGKEGLYYNANTRFLMHCNGFFQDAGYRWIRFSPGADPIAKAPAFQTQETSFFGPGVSSVFFNPREMGQAREEQFLSVFEQPALGKLIGRYRETDQDQAIRLAFIIGGLTRHLITSAGDQPIPQAEAGRKVAYVAEMALLAEKNAVEATTSALAMYVISGGSIEKNEGFEEEVLRMAEAVQVDPVSIKQVRHLGLSELLRLRHFLTGTGIAAEDVKEHERTFSNFPVTGAEFHFDPSRINSRLLQRAALFNIAQYHRGSSIQLSRKDKGVFEVRMDPSDFATASLTVDFLMSMLPALKESNFTLTLTRPDKNFEWKEDEDENLLLNLHGLALLLHAAFYKTMPKTGRSAEIAFGEVYLGQTQRIRDGKLALEGDWSGGRGRYGQVGLHVGYGEMFNATAYYTAMYLAKPELFKDLRIPIQTDLRVEPCSLAAVSSLDKALAIPEQDLEDFFAELRRRVREDEQLRIPHAVGERLRRSLRLPQK